MSKLVFSWILGFSTPACMVAIIICKPIIIPLTFLMIFLAIINGISIGVTLLNNWHK